MSPQRSRIATSRALVLATTCCAALCLLALAATTASASFGFADFDGQVSADEAGQPYTQAGGHPFSVSTDIEFNHHPDPVDGDRERPDGDVKNVLVDLPPGFIGDVARMPACSADQLGTVGFGQYPRCPVDSVIGFATIRTNAAVVSISVMNMVAPVGVPARFGMNVLGVPVLFDALVRSGSDYGITVAVNQVAQALRMYGTSLTLWGVPADPTHDFARCVIGGLVPQGLGPDGACPGSPGEETGPHAAGVALAPLITLPTRCTPAGVGLETVARAESWQAPGQVSRASFFSHLAPFYPAPLGSRGPQQGTTGCESVPFEPRISVRPTSRQADAPTGLDVRISMPSDGLLNPTGIAQANLKKAVVTMPAGMAVNAGAADGLGACSPAQIDLTGPNAPSCPDSAKIGTVSIETPILAETIDGSIYLAKQYDNPFNSTLAIYVTAVNRDRGVVIKLPGEITPDPSTGRLTATFDDNPQLPFEAMSLRFRAGARAVLSTPRSCGTYTTHAEFTSWAQPDTAVANDSAFPIDEGCDLATRFAPSLQAGTTDPAAGAFAPFVLRVTRENGEENLAAIEATLPKGLLAKLAGVPLCGEAGAASGECPAASRVGTTTVGAGTGSSLIYVPQPGRAPTAVYLAGPFKGAPLSLVVKVPAQAGPFDLGTVTVRNALHVDPATAQVTTKSDPLPQILQGIPISYRDVRVDVSRKDFTINPTNCAPMEVASTITAAQGAKAHPSSRFQVNSCERLAFKPKLAFGLSGAPNRRGGFPALKATLTMPKGGANIARAQVTLPKTEILEQGHIRTICTRVQYAAGNCPKASIYGYARAWSPLLDKPLEGPVYLRSSSNPLPDLVASLDGQIHIDLAGRIDSVNARIRNTFQLVPDAPVSKFILTMQGGRKGLLANNTNLCKAKPRATVKFDGHNGKISDSNPLVKVAGCKKK